MRKNSVCHAPYLRSHTWYDFHLWYSCLKDNTSWSFFHFFKILIFRVVKWVKGQKIVRNDKKFCLSCLISQEPYIIWSSFVVRICKIPQWVFFIFSKFWFFGLLGGSRGKNGPKWQKTLSFALYISGTIHHMILIYGTHV